MFERKEMSILFAILIFEAIIIIHELGHFIAAKASGVKVNEFAIGMGPAIIKKKKGDTLYAWRVFPIGGYWITEARTAVRFVIKACQKECLSWWQAL